MSERIPEKNDPIALAGGVLTPHRHVCAFVNSRAEEYRLLDPFLSDGVAHGDRMVYIVDPAERASLVNRYRHLGFDMPKLHAQGLCDVRTWSDTYLHGGHFEPDAMLDLMDQFLDASPLPRVRMVADMGWAAEHHDVSNLVLEYEARANATHPRHGHVVICIYDTARFSADVLIDVLRTHPMALIGGMLQVNPFFVPAAEFLEELRSRDSQPPHA